MIIYYTTILNLCFNMSFLFCSLENYTNLKKGYLVITFKFFAHE